jgi:hypothetical protein
LRGPVVTYRYVDDGFGPGCEREIAETLAYEWEDRRERLLVCRTNFARKAQAHIEGVLAALRHRSAKAFREAATQGRERGIGGACSTF